MRDSPAESPADFRSDTVTRPTEAMRDAMARAEVGDDVYGEDPTVRALEEAAAGRLGKEAALFCPSGTMANLIALLTQAPPGSEVICEARGHSFRSEQAGAARFGGIQLRGLPGDARGVIPAAEVEAALGGLPGAPLVERLHTPRTAMIVVEQTHNFAGGRVQPLAELGALRALAREKGLRVHMDGARLFHAEVATRIPAQFFAAQADTVAFCLSKGLCAPVGSLLCGDAETIERARLLRKALGGGMRQAGVLAAAGLVALTRMVERLAEDHARAKALAEGLAGLRGLEVDPAAVETNIVFAKLAGGAPAHKALAARLRERGILASAVGALGVRFVTHHDVDDRDVERALTACASALSG